MSTAPAPTTHIRLDDCGVAWIDQTNVKVIEVVMDKLAHGLSAEEIYLEHYKHLSLAQIHAAFSYYYDHQSCRVRQGTPQTHHFDVYEDIRCVGGVPGHTLRC